MTSPPKPICTICYEDLNPLVEHLQSIPVCGHVFHELCLQQWLEYCSAGRKPTCPVCKQSCSRDRPTRLYFQSSGDSVATQTATASSFDSRQTPHEPDPEALTAEVKRLGLKLSSLTANLETQQCDIKRLNEEVCAWKEVAGREERKSEEIKKQKEWTEQVLQVKIEELNRKTSECTKLEERSSGLAKELAAIKLATDINLGEEEMVKLASLGQAHNHEYTAAVLRRSLVLRNQSYKELMVQCNVLGRAETRSRQCLEKANEKIRKLKTRLLELEKTLERKENDILRGLKTFEKSRVEGFSFVQKIRDSPLENQSRKIVQAVDEPEGSFSNDHLNLLNQRFGGTKVLDGLTSYAYTDKKHLADSLDDSFLEEDSLSHRPNLEEDLNQLSDARKQFGCSNSADIQKRFVCSEELSSFHMREAYPNHMQSKVAGCSLINRVGNGDEHEQKSQIISNWEKEVLLIGNITKKTPIDEHGMEVQSYAASVPGEQCFPGIIGANSSNRNVGKWCKQVPKRTSLSLDMQGPNSGELITVGADGRGGRIKVLRSHDDFMGNCTKMLATKKSKHKSNRASQQPQLEHFFGKAKV